MSLILSVDAMSTLLPNIVMTLCGKMRNEDEVEKFVRYLLRHVYIVVIKTADFSSAIRLFNVLNTRECH